MNIDQYSPQSGRFLKEDGTYVNIADALGGTETGQTADIEKYTPHTGRFIKEDGTVINIAENIGGGGSGSSDDSAPPIVETYNGQTIQCSMSADRPLKGLNLYATCKQETYEGKNLFNLDDLLSLIPESGTDITVVALKVTGLIPNATYTLSSTIEGSTDGYYTNRCLYFGGEEVSDCVFAGHPVSKSSGDNGEVLVYLYPFRDIAQDIKSGNGNVQLEEGAVPTTYEPYTGGIPSPNGDYPQEIQTISDFAVEVKNSMGAAATPQTLNVTIPEQGFYGIPVSSGGNYTDSSGQQWICDEFDYKRGKYVQRVRKVILDGSKSEGWWLYPDSPRKNYITVTREFEGTKIGQKTSICNMFINKVSRVWDTGGLWVYADHPTIPNKYFNIPKTTMSTLEEWKTWLSTHPLEVLYSLATPVEYDLTGEQIEQFKQLKSYYGTT